MNKLKRMKTKGKVIIFIIRNLMVALKEQVQNIGRERILITRMKIGESRGHRHDLLKIFICTLGKENK